MAPRIAAPGDFKSRSKWAIVDPDGRVALPPAMREALALAHRDDVLIYLEKPEIRLLPRDEAIRHARMIVHQLVPEDVSLTDELIADRRNESADESEND